jgi:hypothetical protein
MRAFESLSSTQKSLFYLLRDNAAHRFRSMQHAFAENSFNLAGEDGEGRQLDGPRGLFLLHSRFNHSCLPNCKIPSGGRAEATHLQSFATRDIASGEEITFEYENDFDCRTRIERHEILRFVCACDACRPGTPFQRLSDMRRRLIRGLMYLETGNDLNGKKQEASSTQLIFDSQLKSAAEALSISLSSRFISGLLRMCLTEQEGLLDDYLTQRLTPSIEAAVIMFQTESNAKIAKLAMAQDTWFERLSVAFHLYGRADAADQAVAKLFSMLRGCS